MKLVFVDTEFTGVHAYATLISVGAVTLEGDELYVTLNDYDQSQVTDWVRQNVLVHIDKSGSVSRREACDRLALFLNKHARGERIGLMSAGKMTDIMLLFQLWHTLYPDRKYFHFELLPEHLNHGSHFDLNTLFFAAGVDPDVDREAWAGVKSSRRHDALEDAKIVRECFLKMAREGNIAAPFLNGIDWSTKEVSDGR